MYKFFSIALLIAIVALSGCGEPTGRSRGVLTPDTTYNGDNHHGENDTNTTQSGDKGDGNEESDANTTQDGDKGDGVTDTNTTQNGDKSDGTSESNTTQDSDRNDTQIKPYSFDFNKTKFALFAWGDLGMHCMDRDYQLFSLLPPYNTLKAQLVVKGRSPRIVNAGVTITYEAIAKSDGTINTSSSDKSNFWDYAGKLFPGVTLQKEVGLAGKKTQSTTPQPMDYNGSYNLYVAEGIPTIPINDAGDADEYPLVKVVAKNIKGEVLAQTVTTLAVSSEMSCAKCHYTDDPSPRMDVLIKHDRLHPDAVKDHEAALQAKGYHYNKAGLVETAKGGTPILCAACHSSNALPKSGVAGIKPLTEAIHGAHASRIVPGESTSVGVSQHRNACYLCHPGESTKCLRGAMGHAVDSDGKSKIECQSCHGTMEAVASRSRKGWIDEPNCQACHHDGKRELRAVTDMGKGTLRAVVDSQFATEKDPVTSHHKLYKHSMGHGGIACSACHGSQHAIYPSSVEEENQQSIDHQGYKGTLKECGACHGDAVVETSFDRGPHGLHPHNQAWVNRHGTVVLRHTTSHCKRCHGSDLKGTMLSKASANRVFKLGVTHKEVAFKAGEVVSCMKCHAQVK